MFEKASKYSISLLYVLYLALLSYYSVYYDRFDIISYTAFLSSAFFVFMFLQKKFFVKMQDILFVVLFISSLSLTLYGYFRALRYPELRISGLLGDRVFEADAAAGLFVYFSAVFFLLSGSRKKRVFSGAAVFATFAYISLLRVKTAYVAIAVCIIVTIIVMLFSVREGVTVKIKSASGNIVLFLSLLVISGSGSLILPYNQPSDRDSISRTITSAFDFNNSTNKARLDFWDASLKMFAENPVKGIGAGMWPGIYPKYNGVVYTDRTIDMNSAVSPHNDYLLFLSEYGLPGLFYLLLILFGIIALFKKTSYDYTKIPLLLVAVCFAVTSFFNFTFENIFAMLFFLFSLSYGYISRNKINERQPRNIFVIPAVIVFAAALIILALRISFGITYKEGIQMKFKSDYKGAAEKLSSISDALYPSDPNRMPVSYYLGTAYYEMKDYANSRRYFDRASVLMPFYPSVMSSRASALYQTGNVKEAINLYAETASMFPYFYEPQINLLAAYANQKMHTEAKKLISDIEKSSASPEFTKNYIVFLEIKNYYERNGL